MSVFAKYDVVNRNWNFDIVVEPYSSTLEIGFIGSGFPMFFNNLKFGFELQSSKGFYTKSYPEPGLEYVSTDQIYLSADSFEADPDETVVLAVSAEHGGVQKSAEISFVVPRPSKPFDSWVWSDELKSWVSPVERPDDENSYVWSESSQQWVLVESPGYEVE